MSSTAEVKSHTDQNADKETNGEDKDDYITKSIGAFGLWQVIFILIGVSAKSLAIWNTMSVVFLAPKTNFRCIKFSNDTATEFSIAAEVSKMAEISKTAEVSKTTEVSNTAEVSNNTCYETCVEYEYMNDVFDETIISQFGLICENKWMKSFAQTIMMLGLLCGVSLFGWISDRYGRSKALMLSGVFVSVFMFASPLCPTYWAFAASRFFTGLGVGGYVALTAVYISELVGTKMIDVVVCTTIMPFDGIAFPIQAVIAYFSATWRSFMVVCSSSIALLVCLTFFLPETPRWLIAKGKETEAIELMSRAAKFNKLDTSNIIENVTRVTDQLKMKDNKDINLTYLDLFRTKKLTIWTLSSVLIWFVTGFTYYGLLQHISQFGSNLYVVVVILGAAQILAGPISLLIVKFCGRKLSSVCVYSTIGVLSLALVFTSPGSIAAVVLGSIGVTAASISFCAVFIIVIELYPTEIRNMGLSFSSIGSKVGAMVAPFVVNMRSKWIASSIFAAAAFSAVLFCFLLPETKGKKLKDTIDEVQ